MPGKEADADFKCPNCGAGYRLVRVEMDTCILKLGERSSGKRQKLKRAKRGNIEAA
jgi:hypothetical protein